MKIKIGAFYYTVTEQEDIAKDNGKPSDGSCDYENLTIKVLRSMATPVKHATILHEAIHAILWQSGIMRHNEALIDIVAHGIYALLIENPKLLHEITGRKETGK